MDVRISILAFVVSVAVVQAQVKAGGLWGDENIISGPALRENDIVTIVLGHPGVTAELAARVVKLLPNGNVVVEASVRCGERSFLLSGEVSPSSVGPDRRLKLGAIASVAIILRGQPPEFLARLIKPLADTEAEGAKSRCR